jgi:hypothetical protein
MAEQQDFINRAKRELSAQELEGLRAYQASTSRGSVVFMPVIKKMGQEIQWTARTYVKGAMGPLPVNKASLKAIGAPNDWSDKAKTFLAALQEEHPALTGVLGDRPTLGDGGV